MISDGIGNDRREIPVRMGSAWTRRCPPTLASLQPRREILKRAAVFIIGFFVLCLLLLCAGLSGPLLSVSPDGVSATPGPSAARPYSAPSGKKPLTLEDVIHPSRVIAPGISALSWRPGGKQLTFIRLSPGENKGGGPTLCAYDLESHTETVLFNPSAQKEKLDLSSYQWSPRGDAILLEGESDLWLLDPQTGGTAAADPGWRGERSPGFLSGG